MQKICFLIIAAVVCSIASNAQDFDDLDRSPHDIVYHRDSKIAPPLIKVTYGRPAKDNREIFGKEVPYGKIWRTGDNEATEIKFYQDVVFGGTAVKKGTYTLVTVPDKDSWQVILNAQTDMEGVFFYNPELNIAEVTVPVKKSEFLEHFSIGFKNRDNKLSLVMAWDTVRVSVPVSMEQDNGLVVRR